MKLILSRKGFDSSSGGVPSPIFPDGRMLSLPIPEKESSITYDDIVYEDRSIGILVQDLTKGRIPRNHGAHIDPDLIKRSLPRLPGWRPLFGQTGPAQSHLRNNQIGPGDLFLFFGLFRQVVMQQGSYTWKPGSKPQHIIWGWLQVAEVLQIGKNQPHGYVWAQYHPHFCKSLDPLNVVYVANDHLQLGNLWGSIAGAGSFSQYSSGRQLTASDAKTPSSWDLPGWLYPDNGRKPLTYHSAPARWQTCKGRTRLKSVGRGQEFVLDCSDYPETVEWVQNLFEL